MFRGHRYLMDHQCVISHHWYTACLYVNGEIQQTQMEMDFKVQHIQNSMFIQNNIQIYTYIK